MNKKDNLKLFGIALALFACFMIVAAVLVTGHLFPTNNTVEDPTSLENNTGVGIDTNPTEVQTNQQSSDVMSLLNKTPYYGKNFAFFYSYSGNYFTLYVSPNNKVAGNAEFDQFLKQNGVENRSWIYDLRTVYVSPTPEP